MEPDQLLTADALAYMMRGCAQRLDWKTYCALRGSCRELTKEQLIISAEMVGKLPLGCKLTLNDHEIGIIWVSNSGFIIAWHWDKYHVEIQFARGSVNSVYVHQESNVMLLREQVSQGMPNGYQIMGNMKRIIAGLSALEWIDYEYPGRHHMMGFYQKAFWATCRMLMSPEAVRVVYGQVQIMEATIRGY